MAISSLVTSYYCTVAAVEAAIAVSLATAAAVSLATEATAADDAKICC